MLVKTIAGILMLLLGFLILSFILIINSGHTSSALSRNDDIVGLVFGIILLAGGFYAIITGKSKK